jgi:hypothetical protein
MDTDPWRFAPRLHPEMDEQFHFHVHMTSQSIPYINPPYVNLTRKGTVRKTRMAGGSSDLEVDTYGSNKSDGALHSLFFGPFPLKAVVSRPSRLKPFLAAFSQSMASS